MNCAANSQDGTSEIGDFVEDEAASEKLEAVTERIDVQRMWGALARLPERDQRVLVRRYGLDGRKKATLRELAEELGLSRERVRQLQRTAELALRARTQLPVPANRRAG
jgi:RNA polymerase sigma factor (sigma-70 family)